MPTDEQRYDSTEDTIDHIYAVRVALCKVRELLSRRGRAHDRSKLHDPEKAIFDEYTPLLKNLTYGSDEYRQALASMKPALDHHYAHNSHHPEHYPEGISGMSLLDIIEMLCDWKAASERHADGSIHKSLEINIKRFGISPELAGILEHTIQELWPEVVDED